MYKKILILEILIFIIVLINLVYMMVANNIPYKECKTQIISEVDEYDIKVNSRVETRQKIEDIVGVPNYFYAEKDLSGAHGLTVLMLRYVVIDIGLNDFDYILSVTHELCHIKYNCMNERFISFKTFEHLYNSEYRDVAMVFAMYQSYGLYPHEYDCAEYINKYLKIYKYVK